MLLISNEFIINLKTGNIRLKLKENYCTTYLYVEYNSYADGTVLNKLISDIMCEKEHMIKFLQTIFVIHKIFILYGSDRNRKSFLDKLLQRLLGNYYNKTPNTLYQVGNHHKADVASLERKKLTVLNEQNSDYKLDIRKINSLTGSRTESRKKMYENFRPIKLQAKHFLIMNKLPKVDTYKSAFWEKYLNIPFNTHFVELPSKENKYQINIHLDELLDKPEFILSFLNFCLEGIKNYYNGRFSNSNIPKEVLIATDKYKKIQLHIEDFIEEYITEIKLPNSQLNNQIRGISFDLYLKYKTWFYQNCNGELIELQTSFGRIITNKYQKIKSNGKIYYMEITENI
jgi:P4 family phage/plasmid primase-like protien